MERQTTLAQTQQQMTTGKRVNVASDDPAAAARSERAQAAQARIDATQKAVNASNNAMTLSESALGNAGDLLQTARETLVSAGNGALGDSDRATLAQTLTSLRSQLLVGRQPLRRRPAITCSAARAPPQAPFSDLPGGVQFQGTTGTSQSASSDALPLSIDGHGRPG